MEHSLYAYLQRQSSETLHLLISDYENREITEYEAETLTMVQEILRQREVQLET